MDLSYEGDRLDTFANAQLAVTEKIKLLANAGFYFDSKTNKVVCFNCNININISYLPLLTSTTIPSKDYYINYHKTVNRTCLFVKHHRPTRIQTFDVYEDKSLHYHRDRVETYIDWPNFHLIDPEELATNGFYYTRYKNKCICVGCQEVLLVTERNISRMRKNNFHSYKYFVARCNFVKKPHHSYNSVNVPMVVSNILDSLVVEGYRYPYPQDVTFTINYQSTGSDSFDYYSDLSILPLQIPFKKDKQTKSQRLLAFKEKEWIDHPKRMRYTPEMLAECGFFPKDATTDRIICYSCGLGVKNLCYMDNLDVIHAQWSKRCMYLTLRKGLPFISEVQKLHPPKVFDYRNNREIIIQNMYTKLYPISHSDLDIILSTMDISYLQKYDPSTQRLLLRCQINKTGLPFLTNKPIVNINNDELCNLEKLLLETTPSNDASTRISILNVVLKDKCTNCKINEANIIFLNCAHRLICADCFLIMDNDECPACRQQICNYIICIPNKEKICKYCNKCIINGVALPCTHIIICNNCLKKWQTKSLIIRSCNICGNKVVAFIKMQ